jgi:hypothetical protein
MIPAMGSSDHIYDLLLLRTFVAALGERATPQWWRTQFLTDIGLRTLTRVFPRTAAAAALNSVVIAAREDHDKRIGIGRRYHLFRLPSNTEHALATQLTTTAFALRMTDIVSRGRDDLIHQIATMAHGRDEVPADGPVRVGSTANIGRDGIERLAAEYHHSFETNRRAFPYFDDMAGGV